MRIRSFRIYRWRHFEDISLELGDDASLVCIVGANGTGKSHILELIAACAHRLGLSQGVDIPRGDPFNDPHSFVLTFHLAPGISEAVDNGLANDPLFSQWDRTLTIDSLRSPENQYDRIQAGGISDPNLSTQFANRVVESLRQSQEVHFLSLDADRSYPRKSYNVNEVAQAYEIDWQGPEYTRGRSFRPSATLYDEWIKFFLAQENQSGTRLMQQMRRANKLGEPPPTFVDHFAGYALALQKVLPHLLFTGIDSRNRTLLFDTTGLELAFNQLSGGEREIAFLIGQIERFGLRKGLFLIDEPELHLNADLIRTWVSYLMSTVSLGQIWLATHSLEAVEAAGQTATFVLERNDQSRKVNTLTRLDARPILSALSRAVGTPAFAISQLRFIFVEGEESLGERERFRRLAKVNQSVRFMECGSCNEVIRRVSTTRDLSREGDASIRIGGIVDRDFRSETESKSLAETHGVFVLPVHEVENLFLHPPTLQALLSQNGVVNVTAIDAIRQAADARAGNWIFQCGMATPSAMSLPDIGFAAKERAKSLHWAEIESKDESAFQQVVDASGFDQENRQKLTGILLTSARLYERKRQNLDLWKSCEGKQTINEIAKFAGFAGKPAYLNAVFAHWERSAANIPEEVAALRSYVDSI